MDIKVGDKFEWIGHGDITKTVTAVDGGVVYWRWSTGNEGREWLADAEDPTKYRRIDAPAPKTPTVRPGQVWKSVYGDVYTVVQRSKNGLDWDCLYEGQLNPYTFSDDEARAGVVTIVQDAPEESRPEPVYASLAALQAAGRAVRGPHTHSWKEQSGGRKICTGCGVSDYFSARNGFTACKPLDPADHDRDIAAKMEAHNAAFHERHKEAIKAAMVGMGGAWPERRYSDAAPEIQLRGRR